jgi:hypothetical protein
MSNLICLAEPLMRKIEACIPSKSNHKIIIPYNKALD